MKKVISVLLATFLTLSMSAQVVYRNGNTYMADGKTMNKKAFAVYMQENAEANLAAQFQNGLTVANAGWGLFGGGLALEIGGLACSIASVSNASRTIYDTDGNQTSDIEISRTITKNVGAAAVGTAFWIIGSSAVTASIVCLGVGYSRMHRSADIYCATHNQKPQAYLSVKADGNGLGLALNF